MSFMSGLDTLNKKPKVYNIAFLTAAVAAGLAVLFAVGGEQEVRLSCLVLAFKTIAELRRCI